MIKLQAIPQHSIIDYEIVESILESDTVNIEECAEQTCNRLRFRNIILNPEDIRNRVQLVASGRQIPLLPSIFTKRLGPRQGKDTAYRRFWNLVEEYIPETADRVYVGLPANQVLSVYPKTHLMVVCEKDKGMQAWQEQVKNKFSLTHVHLLPVDIVNFINDDLYKGSWNIFDLDLMCNTTEELVSRVTSGIACTMSSTGPVLVNITTSIGRCISKQQYRNLMPDRLLDNLKIKKVKVLEAISGRYRDRMVGVAYEHLVITR